MLTTMPKPSRVQTTVYFRDPNLVTRRNVYSSLLEDFGQLMRFHQEDIHLSFERTYAFSFTLKHFDERDSSKDCINYPTTKYKSFKHCDDAFMKEFFTKYDLNPFWVEDESKNLTGRKAITDPEFPHVMANMFKGISVSSECKMPCSSLVVRTR